MKNKVDDRDDWSARISTLKSPPLKIFSEAPNSASGGLECRDARRHQRSTRPLITCSDPTSVAKPTGKRSTGEPGAWLPCVLRALIFHASNSLSPVKHSASNTKLNSIQGEFQALMNAEDPSQRHDLSAVSSSSQHLKQIRLKPSLFMRDCPICCTPSGFKQDFTEASQCPHRAYLHIY